MLRKRVREVVRFLRHNKVCAARRAGRECDHPACRFAVESAEVVEELLAEHEQFEEWLSAPALAA